MTRDISAEEKHHAADLVKKARVAMDAIKDYDQAKIDRLCQAIGWRQEMKTSSESPRWVLMRGELVSYRPRCQTVQIQVCLRDAPRQKVLGIEVDEEKGLVKYAKPAGVIVLVPTTNPE